jgi:hypothetical protein
MGSVGKWIRVLCAVLLLSQAAWVQATENTGSRFASLGFGLEGNMNTGTGFVLGYSINYDHPIFTAFAIGVMVTFSTDFDMFNSFEPQLFCRWYFLDLDIDGGGLFVQEDLGVNINTNNYDVSARFLEGVGLGFRYAFGFKDYYVEPYIRAGYPFILGIGVKGGCRL